MGFLIQEDASGGQVINTFLPCVSENSATGRACLKNPELEIGWCLLAVLTVLPVSYSHGASGQAIARSYSTDRLSCQESTRFSSVQISDAISERRRLFISVIEKGGAVLLFVIHFAGLLENNGQSAKAGNPNDYGGNRWPSCPTFSILKASH